ncbi:uncharacterized protein [Battus philenor]|uniref:uncharacterized protein n=1 Tax=Battus philenor TaxID=42288 RepID=UPI0035D08A76
MGRILCAVAILAVVAMANCEDETRDATLLSSGNDKFTAKMFSEIALKNPSESFVLSAFSVLTPLAQLSLASDGNTHDELLRAIGSPDDQTTKSILQYMNSKLRSMKGIDLKMASKIYIADGYAINDEYAAVSRGTFLSDVKNVDFKENEQTADEINAWVENQTNHRIKDVVNPSSLTADTRAVLVNAFYFKGTWRYPFRKDLTRDRDFHVTQRKTVQVSTMYKRGYYYFSVNVALDAKLLGIPYEGDESVFYIILPNKIDGLTELMNNLKDPSVLENALHDLFYMEVEAYIPKFKIETTTNLKEVLSKVGVNEIFEPSMANLTKLIKDQKDFYISEANQKAVIEINEEGIEVAAANNFGISNLDVSRPQSMVFDADHPFVFLLRTEKIVMFNGVFYPWARIFCFRGLNFDEAARSLNRSRITSSISNANEQQRHMNMAFHYCLLLSIVVGIASCNDGTAPAQLFTDENNKLFVKIFPDVAKNEVNKSFALSPLSVLTTLSQLALASEGSSHEELLDAIGTSDDQSIESVFAYKDTKLRSLKGLISANKIYVDKHYTINHEFAKLSNKVFQSDVQNIDFTNIEQAANEINTWAKDESNDNTEDIVSTNTLSRISKLLLVGVNYFKGMWKNSFHPGHTTDLDFQVTPEKKVPFMYRHHYYNFTHSNDLEAKILEIPYEDEGTSFFIILPDEVNGITNLIEKIKDKSVLDQALNNLEKIATKVYIPKFKLESTISLKESLPSIGVEKILAPGYADLGKLVKEPEDFALNDAIQSVSIEISEEGIEQTLFEFIPPYEPGFVPNFNIFFADHPFLFFVRTGQDILISGVYYS